MSSPPIPIPKTNKPVERYYNPPLFVWAETNEDNENPTITLEDIGQQHTYRHQQHRHQQHRHQQHRHQQHRHQQHRHQQQQDDQDLIFPMDPI
ncbi:MAG: hypothetical protein K0U52_00050 [Gammaproteobacteria bacterium]|nr:hypothetical protein [Gammaproteobacteria bacterium]